jgi:intein/homing endonuclease
MSYKEIGDIIGRTKNAVQCRMRRLGLVKPDKYFYNVDFFENIDTEEKAYWLGFIWADGWVHRSSNNSELGIELKETDTSHLEKFNKSLGGNVEITHHINDQRDNDFMKIDFTYSCKIRLYRKKIVDDVCKYGIDENKTYNDIPIPPQIPDELVRHFIRGFFDGDGTVHYVKNIHTKQLKYIIYNASYVMLESMRQELYKHGIYSQIIEDTRDIKRKTVPCYRLVIGGLENTENFYHYLYDDMTIFLDRKFEYATENREEHNLEERAKRQHGKKTKRDCLSIQ